MYKEDLKFWILRGIRMDDKFKGYINTVRDYLKKKPDKGLPFIKINQGNNKIQHENPMLNEYINFLRECNGADFGTVLLFSWDELPEEESRLRWFEQDWHLWGLGDIKNWICIGVTLTDEVIALNKNNGSIHLFYHGPPPEHVRVLGNSFNEFLENHIFGIKYLEIAYEKDEWYQVLEDLHFI